MPFVLLICAMPNNACTKGVIRSRGARTVGPNRKVYVGRLVPTPPTVGEEYDPVTSAVIPSGLVRYAVPCAFHPIMFTRWMLNASKLVYWKPPNTSAFG